MDNVFIYFLLIVIIVLLTVSIVLLLKRTGDRNQDGRELDEFKADIGERMAQLQKTTAEQFQLSRLEEANHREAVTGKLSEMTRQTLENQANLSDRINRSLGEIRENNFTALTKLQESNEKKLEQMRQTVDEKLNETLGTRLDSTFKTVSEQLENVYKSLGEMKELSAGVTNNVTSLNRVLTNVKARGTWAEVQLQGILDQTIPNMYETNVATKPGSQARVEFAVKIPSGDDNSKIVYLPIDSKFPMEDYVRLCDAADNADADALARARKALEDRIKGEAKAVSGYINEPFTTPFAIMYLATEGLYAEIASSRTGIAEKLQSEFNVMIAGPTTITALLNSLSMGFRAIAINDKANEVRQMLSVAKVQYAKFGDVLDKAHKKIEEAGRTLEEAQHRNSIINKKLKGVEDIELGEAERVLELDSFESD